MNKSFLDRWCASIPGLIKVAEGHWRSKTLGDPVSYPEDDLALLAEIEPNSYWFNHRNRAIEAVMRRFPPNGTAFDIGGGNGYVSQHLCRVGFDCIVVEPDPNGSATARMRKVATVEAAFQELAIPSASLPAIALFDVLEHIADEGTALAGLYASLAPSGRAYVAVPAYRWLWSAEDRHAGHFRRYTRRSLARALRRAGFEVEFSTYLFGVLVPAVLLLRALPSWLGSRQGGGAQSAADHALPDSAIGQFVGRRLQSELARLQAGATVLMGTSVLAVARRRDAT